MKRYTLEWEDGCNLELRDNGDYVEYEEAAALEQRVAELESVLGRVNRLIGEALPKFNWGASALGANAITLLNEVPGEVRAALASKESAPDESQ